MSMPELMHVSEGPRRFDLFTGGGRRRRFTAGEKAAIVEESYAEGTSVCGVARRHGLTPQQLFGWRRLARLGPSCPAERPLFVPVILASDPEVPSNEPSAPLEPRRRRRSERASIELEIDGVVVRVGRDADAGAIAAVIGALTRLVIAGERRSEGPRTPARTLPALPTADQPAPRIRTSTTPEVDPLLTPSGLLTLVDA